MKELNKLYSSTILAGIVTGVIGIVLPIYLRESFGTSLTSMGLIFATMSFMFVVLQIPFGHLADKIGKKPVIIISEIFFILALTVFGFAKKVGHFVVGKGFEGVYDGMSRASWNALMVDLAEKKSYGKSFGSLIGSFGIGFTLGYFMAGKWVEFLGYRNTILSLILLEIVSILFFLWLKEPKFERKIEVSLRKIYSIIHRYLKVLALVSFLVILVESMDYTVTIIFLRESLGASITLIGIILGLSFLFFGITPILFGRIADKFGWRKFAMIGLLIVACMAFLLPFAGSILLFTIFFSILGFGHGMAWPGIYALVAKHTSQHTRGKEFAFTQTFAGIGALVGLPLMGWITDTFGFTVPFIVRGVVVLLSVIILFLFVKER